MGLFTAVDVSDNNMSWMTFLSRWRWRLHIQIDEKSMIGWMCSIAFCAIQMHRGDVS